MYSHFEHQFLRKLESTYLKTQQYRSYAHTQRMLNHTLALLLLVWHCLLWVVSRKKIKAEILVTQSQQSGPWYKPLSSKTQYSIYGDQEVREEFQKLLHEVTL